MPATGSRRPLAVDENSVVAARFDWRMTESYNMSIQLRLDGLSFSILDPVTNVYLYLSEVNLPSPDAHFARQEEYILKSQVLARRYRRVCICVESPAYTMMPSSLYDERRIGGVMALSGIRLKADDRVLRNDIELANSTTAFTLPNFLYFFLRTQFPNAEIFHETTPMVSSMLLKRQGDYSAASVSLSLAADSMTIVATRNNELQLCNTFYCREAPDYAYMLLYVMEQLQFDASTTTVRLSGCFDLSDARVGFMRRFVPHLELASLPAFFDYAISTGEKSYRYNTLFLLPLCV